MEKNKILETTLTTETTPNDPLPFAEMKDNYNKTMMAGAAAIAERSGPNFKYDEARLLEDFRNYVASTYGKHYVGKNNIQSLDLIFSTGHGIGFCVGNILKYGARLGKKKGEERSDMMKILHYTLLLQYLYNQEENLTDLDG